MPRKHGKPVGTGVENRRHQTAPAKPPQCHGLTLAGNFVACEPWYLVAVMACRLPQRAALTIRRTPAVSWQAAAPSRPCRRPLRCQPELLSPLSLELEAAAPPCWTRDRVEILPISSSFD